MMSFVSIFFFFNDTATTEIYTLSLHDALPISLGAGMHVVLANKRPVTTDKRQYDRSEEHTSELQSQSNLVCRLLLEKKKIQTTGSSSSYINAVHDYGRICSNTI